MADSPSQTVAGASLAALLAERGVFSAQQALELACRLARQLAELHAAGTIHGKVSVSYVRWNEVDEPRLELRAVGTSAELTADWAGLIPDLLKIPPFEPPAPFAAVQKRLDEAGFTITPWQVDFCQLGALLCRLMTGEPAAGYLRSPRVRGLVPGQSRPIMERLLGIGDRERFADASEIVAAFQSLAAQSEAAPEIQTPVGSPSGDAQAPDLRASSATGDTTPSFVSSSNQPADTSVGGGPSRSRSDASSAGSADAQPLPFDRLGHYEIVRRIGRGGMGDVYLGYEAALERKVAIKVLPADLARDDEFVRRFRSEATAVARLNHPHIVPIHFIGEDRGHHYYAMQFVEGESLAERLARDERLAVEETLRIVSQVLAGLAAAHERGMVHRDIKPGNILLDRRSGRALLADFGLVKSLDSSAGGRTATGVVMGTVDYISPEQGRGRAVDHRSDLYSVGVLLYRMLSGRLPFTANSPTALIFQHVYEPAPLLTDAVPETPFVLAKLVARLLSKSPADRHQSAEDILADISSIQSGQPLELSPTPLPSEATIVRLPVLDDEIPEVFIDAPVEPRNWWGKARDRALSLFRRNAPEVLLNLQNTQQQMDGAVAVYERRCRQLQELTDAAESVLGEIVAQARVQRSAGARAAERARAAADSAERQSALDERLACERAAEELDRHVADQKEELGQMRLRLAHARARMQELQNQRDILNARLKAARAERHLATGAKVPARRRLIGPVLAIALFVAAGVFVFVRLSGSGTDHAQRSESNSPGPRIPDTDLVVPTASVRNFINEAIEKRLALSRDGTRMAVARYVPVGTPGTFGRSSKPLDEIKLWDLTKGSEVLTFEEPHHSVRMAISPDGQRLLSAGKDSNTESGEFKIWNTSTGKVVHRQQVGVQKDAPLGFSSDGKMACIVMGPGVIQDLGLFELENGTLDKLSMPTSDDQIASAAFSPVAEIAAVSIVVIKPGGRVAIDIHDLRKRQMIHSFAPSRYACELTFSGDGRVLAGSSLGRLVAWETSNWTEVASHPANNLYERLAVSYGGRFVACLLKEKVEVFDTELNRMLPVQAPFKCLDIAFTLGDTLIVAADEIRFAYFDPETGKEQLSPKLKAGS